MTPTELRTIRRDLGLTRGALSRIVRQPASTIKHWETSPDLKSHRAIPGAAEVLLEQLAAGKLLHLIAAGRKCDPC